MVTAPDRAAFKRCRRQWDLGARLRRNLEPIESAIPASAPAQARRRQVREALAVHYFPGMWAWDRAIVQPLVLKAAGPEAPFVERYLHWAVDVDDFEPLRVETDFDARIPDPRGGDLATAGGWAVHHQGRADALVIDEDRVRWLLVHRFGPWTDVDLLRLDETAVTSAWAWEQTFLDTKVGGVLFNEITDDGRFRRSVVPLARATIESAGRQLGTEALEMLDPGLSVYPNPDPGHCGACPFLDPCTAMFEGQDAEVILARSFRPRPADEVQEGRLGGATWSMGRGAAPPTFGRR
ncbi:MAG: hypothetical protein WKF43_13305 [Acidimicrobiales bacterium]